MPTLLRRQRRFVARFARPAHDVDIGCAFDVGADGSAVLVIDGERLFHFGSVRALLEHYAPACG